ncbi:MAG: hypothetical protein KGL37_10490 [Acidobacteriota bacterium]|nr:hypothetical protein [Acidobacteriota bacterium]
MLLETSELGDDLQGQRLLFRHLHFNGAVLVHGDLERDVALLHDEADIVADGKVIGIISDAADRRDDNRR